MLTIYQKPTCTTCRQVYSILKEAGIDFRSVNYYLEPIPKRKLQELLRKMGLTPKDILRTKEPVYRTLGLDVGEHSDEELLDLLVQYPDLLQRPIVERGNRAILARPAEKIRDIL